MIRLIRAIAAAYRGAFSGLSRPVWLLAVAGLVNRSGTMVLPFLALYLTEERGFSTTGAGQALALYGLGGMAGSFLGGWLSDRLAPRTVMGGSLVLTAVGFFSLGQIRSPVAILVTMPALSLVGELFRPANAAAFALASAPEERIRAFALNRLAINVGMTLGPAVGGFLALYDYSWLFRVDALTCLAAAALLWLFFRDGANAPEPRAAAPVVAPRSPWRDGPFLALIGLMFTLALVFFQLASTYTLSLRDLFGYTEARIGLLMAVNTLIIVLFEMVLVHALVAVPPLKLLAYGSFLFCLGFGLLPFGTSFVYVIFTIVLWSLGEMLSMPAATGAVAGRATEANRGSYMGIYMLAFSSAYVAAPLAGTWVYQRLGPRVLWLGCILIGLPLWAGFMLLARRLAGTGEGSGAVLEELEEITPLAPP